MAEATSVKVVETITLTLSRKEAEAIHAVTAFISGSVDSPRLHTSEVGLALHEVLGDFENSEAYRLLAGNDGDLHFRDYE